MHFLAIFSDSFFDQHRHHNLVEAIDNEFHLGDDDLAEDEV